jgi:hypothetical protein
MPVTGRKSKPEGQAVNRNKPVHDWTEVASVPFEGGPDLPEMRADGRRWQQRTRDKWDAWRSMPHCKLWGPAEWDFALDSIELAATFHDTGESKFGTELRNREKILGTTLDFLRDLRIRYTNPPDETGASAEVTNIADYRDL